MPDLDSLRLFLHVAAAGSFSRAAGLAGTTQPAVSKRILTLERELGAHLFDRTGRGARLTDAGRSLRPRAEALVREADTLADAVAAEAARPRGTVRIAFQPSIAWPMVRELFVRTRAAYPQIHLEIAEAPTEQIVEWLHAGRRDLGVLSKPVPDAPPEAEHLFSLPLYLVSRAGDPLTRRPTVTFRQVAGLPLVLFKMPNGARLLLEEMARRRNLRLNVIVDLHSIHLIKKFVRDGFAYSIAQIHAVEEECAAGQLAASRVVSPSMAQTFYLSMTQSRRPSAAVQAVARLVREIAGRG